MMTRDFKFGHSMNPLQSPRHDRIRRFLRIGGLSFLIAGIACTGIGVWGFFIHFFGIQRPGDGPSLLFLFAFVGIPLMFVGAFLGGVGFLGAVTRFLFAEQAPHAADAANLMAQETQEAVRTVARAASQGAMEGVERARSAQNKPPAES